MKTANEISLKSDEILKKKKNLNLALNLLISFLGISSLFIKFFLVDGVLAFRAFTVDGNLFTTIVSVCAVVVNIREIVAGKELSSKRFFYLQLASAVTEAVIFIVVMIGYLPIFPDDPKITPYHMFCLHVAIPILAVARFIFFEKPLGVLKPPQLLIGAIPIGVYCIGVVSAIKLGILPVSLVPYSFLDFKNNFLWYFLFALVVIPSFGYLWSWLFYRLNLRASLLWYDPADVEKLDKARIKALSSFDAVNSGILLVYCVLAVFVLMFSLMGTSKTSTAIQHELLSDIGFYMLDDYDHMLARGDWTVEDGVLFKGILKAGDGTEEGMNTDMLPYVVYDVSFYIPASDLSPELAEQYEPTEYVSVLHSGGETSPIAKCGETLDAEIVSAVFADSYDTYYKEVKVGKIGYYHFYMAFGGDMLGNDVGIIELCIPSSEITEQAKNAEINNDIMMTAVIVAVFSFLYFITYKWIRTLEDSIEYLKQIAGGRAPEEPIVLGKSARLSGLARELNVLREINRD